MIHPQLDLQNTGNIDKFAERLALLFRLRAPAHQMTSWLRLKSQASKRNYETYLFRL